MEYYVIAPDGQRYGPVDIATLNDWVQANRVTASSTVETATGQRMNAAMVPGIVLPASPPPPAYPTVPPAYGAAPRAPYAAYPHAPYTNDDGQSDVTKAWIFGALGLVCCPILFSTLGIVFANNAKKKGHPQAQNALIFSIITLILRVTIGVMLKTFIGSP